MKLVIVLAEASRVDGGIVSALGLGITRLGIDRLPGQFHGALVLIATPEDGDPLESKFSLTLTVPGQQPQQFAVGSFKAGGFNEPAVLTHSFDMLVAVAGVYSFRMELGTAWAETRLTVGLQSTKETS